MYVAVTVVAAVDVAVNLAVAVVAAVDVAVDHAVAVVAVVAVAATNCFQRCFACVTVAIT